MKVENLWYIDFYFKDMVRVNYIYKVNNKAMSNT